MKRLLLLVWMGLMAFPCALALAQTQTVVTSAAGKTNIIVLPNATNFFSSFINDGTLINPQIDAVEVINNGTLLASTLVASAIPEPFKTSDTLRFTNTGTMSSIVGWHFDDSPASSGVSKWAQTFFNDVPGLVEARDQPAIIVVNQLNAANITPSYLIIEATNIINRGEFSVGANGIMELTGSHLDLQHSLMSIVSVADAAQGSSYAVLTNYFRPDVAIYDRYWGTTNINADNTLDTSSLWNSNNVATAPSEPADPAGAPSFHFLPTLADSYTNILAAGPFNFTNSSGSGYVINLVTNLNKGAIFIAIPEGFFVQAGFTPGLSNFDTAAALISLPRTNPITGQAGFSYIYFEDTLASGSGKGLLINALSGNTMRPTNYYIDRLNHSPGPPGNNGFPEGNFFVDSGNLGTNSPTRTNVVIDLVTNFTAANGTWAAYSPFIDDVVSRPPAVVGGTITNLPGSIKISADDLNLDNARFSANGQITVLATHLISSSNLVLNAENLNFDVGAPASSGKLKVQNLINSSVGGRIQGPIRAWSATWSNTVMLLVTNNYSFTNAPNDTNGNPGPLVLQSNAPIQIFMGVGYHTLMLDARSLINTFPVYVYDFHARGDDIDFRDQMTVLQSLLIDGRSFTLNGSITIPGAFPASNPILLTTFPGTPITDWMGTNAPRLQFFTNNGALTVANEAHFGDDRASGYATFVNHGNITAGGILVNSSYFEAGGQISADGVIQIQCDNGKLVAGSISSGVSTKFLGNTVKFFAEQISAGGSLDFGMTGDLSDAGPSSGNLFQVQNGFNLVVKPQTGDLLGTTLRSGDTTFAGRRITHTWAGEDRGASASGFSNNVAIGTLAFSSQSALSQFVLSGTGARNGLYVDLLDLSALGTNFETELQINPSLVIYFAAARLGFTPPPSTNGIAVQPEEFLDGKFGGHLRWVQSFAGPNSSTDVIVTNPNGVQQSMSVNFALRWSLLIDSDGDGTANGLQATPFKVATAAVQISGNGSVLPNYNGQLLLAGVDYGMSAQPADGSIFSGWTGDIQTNSPQLNFVMPTSGLNVTANFTFQFRSGNYGGIFFEPQPQGIEFQRSGAFTLTTTKSRRFSGAVQLGSRRFGFSGKLDDNGEAQVSPNGSGLTMQFQLGSNAVTGTIGDGQNWTANLQGDRAIFTARNKAPFAGKYTILFPGTGDPSNTTNSQGDGYGTVTVDASGRVHLIGALSDGTRIVQTATVTENLQWPLFVGFPRASGQLLGLLNFSPVGDQDINGWFDWIKQPNDRAHLYPDGFNFQTNAIGSKYNSKTNIIMGFGSGTLMLSGGNLDTTITNTFALDARGRIIPSDPKSKIIFSKAQGLFSGSVLNPNTGKPIRFNGAILQSPEFGSGFFLGTNQSGTVSLNPR